MERIDSAELNRLANGNMEFVLRMLEIFSKSLSSHVTEMKVFLEGSDLLAAADKAHKLAPSCRHLGLNGFVKSLDQFQSQVIRDQDSRSINNVFTDIQSKSETILHMVNEEIESVRSELAGK